MEGFVFMAWFAVLVIVINVLVLRWVFKINEIVFHLKNIASDTDDLLKHLKKGEENGK